MVWLEDSCVTRNLTRRSISCSIPIPVLVSIPSRHYMSRLLINGMCRFTFLVLQNPLASILIRFLVYGNIVLMETCRCSIVHWNNTNNYKGICKLTVIITLCATHLYSLLVATNLCVYLWASHCWHVYRSSNSNLSAFSKNFLGASRVRLVCAFLHSSLWMTWIHQAQLWYPIVVVLWDSSEAGMDSAWLDYFGYPYWAPFIFTYVNKPLDFLHGTI